MENLCCSPNKLGAIIGFRACFELFVNGRLPKALWKFSFFVIMIPFLKLAQLKRDLLSDPRLRPITIGSLLTRLSCRSLLRLNKAGQAERMLRSNMFSYGILGGVQLVIMRCIIALQCNPTFVRKEFDLVDAHTDCSRSLIWEELMNDT